MEFAPFDAIQRLFGAIGCINCRAHLVRVVRYNQRRTRA
ncbi:hypothetical protein AZ54_06760 [Xanthomonas oryzae pv. oryzae PXO86]|nr:hypothetical protein AZ54_06760 [Xanthomonas oryzae pv. oryzae PXO86]